MFSRSLAVPCGVYSYRFFVSGNGWRRFVIIYVINITVVVEENLSYILKLFDHMAAMNNRPNVGKGDLKTLPFKTETASLAGKQPDPVQRDKGSRFSSVRDSDSRVEQNQAKKTDVDKVVKSDPEAPDVSDSSATDTQSLEKKKKFSGRCRLFVGNLPNDMSENEFQKFFEPYGELNEVFLNASRGFGFLRLVSMFLDSSDRSPHT